MIVVGYFSLYIFHLNRHLSKLLLLVAKLDSLNYYHKPGIIIKSGQNITRYAHPVAY